MFCEKAKESIGVQRSVVTIAQHNNISIVAGSIEGVEFNLADLILVNSKDVSA